ncbi:cytochrome c oxidase subunit II [Salinicoccus roseus]|uniref:cytochrome c oxidase subunit II n=1 Tax=Salinicoccus roseus TaxID=45670 RepID=UPI000F4D3C66|nr:cytochrome c oxidase subunit II [Salinicoccus roseus]RPE54566.1 cytochrome c oxidase subunit 2 [Salinicoccus roseus]GGA64587.1 cytochrome c oxidase subunit 2 [Salinicoccus roseus]
MKNRWMNAKWLGLITLLAVFASGCGKNQLSTLKPAGEVGQEQFNLMLLSIVIMLLVVAVVSVVFTIAVIKSRRKNLGEEFEPKDVAGNHTLEVIWTAIPILLLIILAVPTIYLTFKQADTQAMENEDGGVNSEETVINVTANQYWWEFEYPNEEVVTSQELVVPTDKKVYFNLKAADVKHSFWVPAAGGKLDTNVDGINSFYLTFDEDKAQDSNRLFYGKCAELCGPSHALMDFKVKALPEEEYDQWLADMKNIEEPVQASADDAAEGQEIFNNSCIGCHAVTPTGTGAQGPNLTNFGDRDLIAGFMEHNEENLVNWIKDPESYKPDNKMTGQYDLTDEEINAVAAYLMELKVEEGAGDVETLRESAEEGAEGSEEESSESEEGGN